MKPVMELNGILYCTDLQLMCVMNRILDDFAIETTMCASVATAQKAITDKMADCILLEWGDAVPSLIKELRSSPLNSGAFVIAIVGDGAEMKSAFASGASLAIQKDLTAENVTRSMRAAYGFLIRQRRAARRLPVSLPTKATVAGRTFTATIVDLSEGGLCLLSQTRLQAHDTIQIGIPLPIYQIAVTCVAKVIWVVGHKAGLKFSHIPPRDYLSLKEFIELQSENPRAIPKPGMLPTHAYAYARA